MKKRVVITGMGALSPIGNNVEETWQSLVNGKSGIGMITRFDASGLPAQIAAEVKDFNPEDHFEPNQIRKLDLYSQFALVAAKEAIQDAKLLEDEKVDKERVGVITGVG
ncbi:MAG TPA: beta-ketoacyl-[acyl-carrier-protein] synthase II, partial [Candidatus Cloacimonas sp.]|nr:beta-ketoacyl-[acyl-carrier-protein] synthase II [Candidatus Cloacimonas sp.]